MVIPLKGCVLKKIFETCYFRQLYINKLLKKKYFNLFCFKICFRLFSGNLSISSVSEIGLSNWYILNCLVFSSSIFSIPLGQSEHPFPFVEQISFWIQFRFEFLNPFSTTQWLRLAQTCEWKLHSILYQKVPNFLR